MLFFLSKQSIISTVSNFNLGRTRGHATPTLGFFSNSLKYDLFSGAETFRSYSFIRRGNSDCQLYVYDFWCCHGNRKFHVGLAKNRLYWHNSVSFSSFLHQIAEIHEFLHCISILAWFSINFWYSYLTFKENSEIQDGGSNNDICRDS